MRSPNCACWRPCARAHPHTVGHRLWVTGACVRVCRQQLASLFRKRVKDQHTTDPAYRTKFDALMKSFQAPAVMTLAVLRAACGNLGFVLTDAQVKDLSALFDIDNDGKVMSDEFVLFCHTHADDVFAMTPPPPRGHLVGLEFLPSRSAPASSRAVPLCRGVVFGARGDEATLWATFVYESDVKADKKLAGTLISDVVLFHMSREPELEHDGFDCLGIRPVGDSWLGHGEHLWARRSDRDTIGDMIVTVADAGPPYPGFRRVTGDLNLGGGPPVTLWYYKTRYENDTLQAKHARRRELVVEDTLAQFRGQCLKTMPWGKWTNAAPAFAKLMELGAAARAGGAGGGGAAVGAAAPAAGGGDAARRAAPAAAPTTMSEDAFTAALRRFVPVELSEFEVLHLKNRLVRTGTVSLADLQALVCRDAPSPAGPARLLISALLPAIFDRNRVLGDLFQVRCVCRARPHSVSLSWF